jgi:hypothetical protein
MTINRIPVPNDLAGHVFHHSQSKNLKVDDVAFDNAIELILYLFIGKVCQTEPHLQKKLYGIAELFTDDLPVMMKNQLKKSS